MNVVNSSLMKLAFKEGDIIDLVAPASSCPEDHLIKAVQWLTKLNLVPRFSEKILKPTYYLAQSDDERFLQLEKALLSPDSKGIWCLRGGYGSIRLIPSLLKLNKPEKQKLFIGLSDITSLHQFLIQNWNWSTLHASLLDRVGQGLLPIDNEKLLIETIFGKSSFYLEPELKWLNPKPFDSNLFITGVVIGGNLTTFMSSFGTALQLKKQENIFLKNKNLILFFEDIGERGYKVDRFLQQLKQSTVLQDVSAIVFGDFTGCEEKNGENLVPFALQEFANSVSVPVLSGVRSGHGQWQSPLFFNTHAELSCGMNSKLVIFPSHENK